MKTPGLNFRCPIVCRSSGILHLLLDQITLFLLLRFWIKAIHPLKSVFTKCCHLEFNRLGVFPNRISSLLALFTRSLWCFELISCARATFQGFNWRSSFSALQTLSYEDLIFCWFNNLFVFRIDFLRWFSTFVCTSETKSGVPVVLGLPDLFLASTVPLRMVYSM